MHVFRQIQMHNHLFLKKRKIKEEEKKNELLRLMIVTSLSDLPIE